LGLQRPVIYFGCLIVAVIIHEISHGVVALWFGDKTAQKAGRLTLNPIPHIEPVRFGHPAGLRRDLRDPGDRMGQARAGGSDPDAPSPPRHAVGRPRRALQHFAMMVLAAIAARAIFQGLTAPPGSSRTTP